jgi:hypothetical protein
MGLVGAFGREGERKEECVFGLNCEYQGTLAFILFSYIHSGMVPVHYYEN